MLIFQTVSETSFPEAATNIPLFALVVQCIFPAINTGNVHDLKIDKSCVVTGGEEEGK